jgi:hypothetical protein
MCAEIMKADAPELCFLEALEKIASLDARHIR